MKKSCRVFHADLVRKSYKARQKAKALLDKAKAKVEELIQERR